METAPPADIWSDRGEGGPILVCKKGSFMGVLFYPERKFSDKYFRLLARYPHFFLIKLKKENICYNVILTAQVDSYIGTKFSSYHTVM
jgi:hypothetical protein